MITMVVAPESTSWWTSSQGAEKGHRIGEHVRQHDGDPLACRTTQRLAQEAGKGGAGALPLRIGHDRAEEVEGRTLGMARAGAEQQRMQRGCDVRIDLRGNAGRIGGERGCLASRGREGGCVHAGAWRISR
jgi:hypothetical protein